MQLFLQQYLLVKPHLLYGPLQVSVLIQLNLLDATDSGTQLAEVCLLLGFLLGVEDGFIEVTA